MKNKAYLKENNAPLFLLMYKSLQRMLLWPSTGGGIPGSALDCATVTVLGYHSLFCEYLSHRNHHCHGFMSIVKIYFIKAPPLITKHYTLIETIHGTLKCFFFNFSIFLLKFVFCLRTKQKNKKIKKWLN